MKTKDLSRLIDIDTMPKNPNEFVRYDENGQIPGVLGEVIEISTQTTVDDIDVPAISALQIRKVVDLISQGKSVCIYDKLANVFYLPSMCDQSAANPSFTILYYWLAVVDYQISANDAVQITVHKFVTEQ